MSSSYTDGERIALDITDTQKLETRAIADIIAFIKSHCDDDVPLSTHLIETDSPSWGSVVKYDPFFTGVKVTDSAEEFSEKIKRDRVLYGLDVANYIASKTLCTHLELEKLVYLAYAEYLCSCGKKLFQDTIYAFEYGPVVDSVYQAFKGSGYDYVHPKQRGRLYSGETSSPAKSRILFAKDGAEKLQCIDDTLKKYGRFNANELVGITHRDGSPWTHVKSYMPFQVIPDDIILKYHHVEQV